MVRSKRINTTKLALVFIFLYLFLFPLGQLLRTETMILGRFVVFQPIEILTIPLTILAIKNIRKFVTSYPHLITFFSVLLFSLIVSLGGRDINFVLIGLFYFVRVVNFIGIFYGAYVLRECFGKDFIIKILSLIGISILLFGWTQYLFAPDLRILSLLGWDDHAYRLSGTFLDPGFTGILLTLASLVSMNIYLRKRKVTYLLLTTSLVFGVLFTYSRGSYLALLAGVSILIYFSKYSLTKLILYGTAILIVLVVLLPRPGGEGIRLERTGSIYARLRNYSETYEIWKESPVFGIGFNNLCAYRLKQNPDAIISSHSCSGADSSIMMLLTTSGIIGIIAFMKVLEVNIRKIGGLRKNRLFYSSFVALLAHSLFTNSLFYPWVVGWIAFVAIYSIPNRSFRGSR